MQGRRRSVSGHFHSLYGSMSVSVPTLEVDNSGNDGVHLHANTDEGIQCNQREPHIQHSEQVCLGTTTMRERVGDSDKLWSHASRGTGKGFPIHHQLRL